MVARVERAGWRARGGPVRDRGARHFRHTSYTLPRHFPDTAARHFLHTSYTLPTNFLHTPAALYVIEAHWDARGNLSEVRHLTFGCAPRDDDH